MTADRNRAPLTPSVGNIVVYIYMFSALGTLRTVPHAGPVGGRHEARYEEIRNKNKNQPIATHFRKATLIEWLGSYSYFLFPLIVSGA